MTQIRADHFSDFTQAVAEAVAAGESVTILTGPETAGGFVAQVGEAPTVTEAPAEEAPAEKPAKSEKTEEKTETASTE